MARLALLLVLGLLSACHLEDVEQIAIAHHPAHRTAWSELDAQSITTECQAEAARLRFTSPRTRNVSAVNDPAYLNACFREVSIMRAYGRR